jgi:hydrogenase expression/formation protein HypC
MCLAIPARVVSIHSETDMATVSLGEIEKQVSLALVEGVGVDDYVLVHVGYALHKISEEEAQKTLELFAEAGLVEAPA